MVRQKLLWLNGQKLWMILFEISSSEWIWTRLWNASKLNGIFICYILKQYFVKKNTAQQKNITIKQLGVYYQQDSFYVQEGEGAIMCNLSLGDNAYRQMIEKHKVFKIKIFVSIYLRMTESEGNLCSQ